MPSKRKRDILEGFDPNASDPEDENFDPSEDRPPRSSKKSRSTKSRRTSGGKSRPRSNKYRGSDIDDDDDDDDEVSESEDENSFAEEEDEDEEDEDLPVTSTGRRMRKAAVQHPSYKESSEDEDGPIESVEEDEIKPTKKPSRIVVLKTNLRGRPKKEPAVLPPPTTRRATRARTEETEEPLVELSNSGRHAQVARASRSKSPETMSRATRATRGAKGVKQPPPPIEEATQESDSRMEAEAQIDTLAEPTPSDNEKESEKGAADGALDNQEDGSSDEKMEDVQPEAEAENQDAEDEDDDDDDVQPLNRRTRAGRAAASAPAAEEEEPAEQPNNGTGRRLTRRSRQQGKKNLQEPSSDFEPGEESGDAEMSASEASVKNGRGGTTGEEDSSGTSPTRRGRGTRSRSARKRADSGDEEVELDRDEMAEELEELRENSRSRARKSRRRSPSIQYEERISNKRRTARTVNYTIPPVDAANFEIEEEDEPNQTPAKNRKGGKSGASQGWQRVALNTTYGPFGGGSSAGAVLGGPWGTGATGGVDSDSSDDEMVQRSGVGGTVGMTPTSAAPPGGLFSAQAAANTDVGAPNVGKIKSHKALADADPLGVDASVDFSKVGGLDNHINQLKEMVQLPLLYPEVFQQFKITPPRGVLFHGPPGTGKTLLARALSQSLGEGGQKVTFYMRKGADALSKWVGEAEKQLRLLFEEARRTQPSIIFFDEIDGLAPVRSSKQEQIHASIVATLLALMDGMDGRGQVIVIGATNRPDNIDPALRRPGRFDREFYFPLPDLDARTSIINIHTEGWGLSDSFKRALAENTKGYGGADLRAMCTEAAINAIQRTFPQVYGTREKLLIDPAKIIIHASDFMLSAKKMVPSSERSAVSAAAPIPPSLQPLLKEQYEALISVLDSVFPRPKKTTALEEAMFEQPHDTDHGFGREKMHQEFERSRVFRPRLLVAGERGMGQTYLASACLHYMEGVHVQNFDLATLLGDSRPLEEAIVGRFTEVRRHRPSVIFIPAIDDWWETVNEQAIRMFITMLKSIPPTAPVLLLATADTPVTEMNPDLLRNLFGFSKKNRVQVDRPTRENRVEFFSNIITHLRKSPVEFPDPADRKKRVLEELPLAPPPPPKVLTKEEIKAQRKADLHALNLLKMRLQPIMEQINKKYRKFRQPAIPMSTLEYLLDEADPNHVRPDVAEGQRRPYEIDKDKEGTSGIRETATGKFFYNLETSTIEERLANGYYARPIDFYKDINRLFLDAKQLGDKDRILKAAELRTNVEVDVHDITVTLAGQGFNFEALYQRQLERAKETEEKERKRKALQPFVDLVRPGLVQSGTAEDSESQGPVGIGVPMTGMNSLQTTAARFRLMSPKSNGHSSTTNGTSVPSRQDGDDIVMSDIAPDSQAQQASDSFWGRPPPMRPLGDSTRAIAGTQLSQRSAVTTIPPGVSPSQIINDASTTKTSDPSTNRGENWSTQRTNTQHTNGLNNNADNDTQLVDTQSQNRDRLSLPSQASQASQATSSERDWAHSQAAGIAQGLIPRMGMHSFSGAGLSEEHGGSPSSSQRTSGPRKSVNATSLDNILNDETPTTGAHTPATGRTSSLRHSNLTSASSQPLVIHEGAVEQFLQSLVQRTSGCTVEQLEQINRELLDEIWRTRGEYNRMSVLSALTYAFNDTISDIELVQNELQGSEMEKSETQPPEKRAFIYLRRDRDDQEENPAASISGQRS
ncbi:hypothetical protein OQA88_229 [Cercophora sp. LCS_1]